ncbi:unnamed protein product [Arabidopsis lyrata]|nr:unnamed protein product [Arabidopsis lyrata]
MGGRDPTGPNGVGTRWSGGIVLDRFTGLRMAEPVCTSGRQGFSDEYNESDVENVEAEAS